jgi:hypothetical protein
MLARAGGTYVHRIYLTAEAPRRLSWIFCLVTVFAAIVLAVPGVALAADPKIEKEAEALQKKAIEEDNLNVNYAGAIKKLQSAVTKCDGGKCNSTLKASLLRDLGAMQVLNGSVDEGKASFAQALGMDSAIDLDPSYKNPQVESVWNDVKKNGGGGGGGGGAPIKVGPQPTGDFVHTPPAEALVRTPLPIYVEYSGSEELTRVIAKYKGFGQSEWKTLELKKIDSAYGAMIPCKDVTQGVMRYFVQGFSDQHDPVANSGTRAKPFSVAVNLQITGLAPALPGEEPPEQCADTGECPPDFPGCGGKKKPGGEECSKDAECESGSCSDDKCVEKKGSGEDCSSDSECNSGTCSSGKCGGGKKGEGEDCDSDVDCDSDKCTEGRCAASASSSGKLRKLWIGFGAQGDIFFMPGANDVCLLTSKGLVINSAGYTCIDAQTGNSFPSNIAIDQEIRKGVNDQVVGGMRLGNIRLLASLDYALSRNVLLGLRVGFVLLTDPIGAPFPPLHLEGRLTYAIGKNALSKQGVSPILFAGVGAGEFDAAVPVTVSVTTPKTMAFPQGQNLSGQENAWLTAGPVFFSAGAGLRALGFLSPRVAATIALKFEGAFGGAAGFMPGVAPEVGLQYGF